MASRTWAVVAGGGTAGHVMPAIAIGRALVARGHPAETVHFVGSSRGIEAGLVPEAGFAVTLLPGRGIQRRLTLANVGAVWGLLRAFVRGVALVARQRPAVVVSVGGYASAPCALAAVLLRVPLVLAEQNAVPGAVHRLVGRFARAAAVSFESTPLPRAVVTGNPVRPELLAVDRARDASAARKALGVPGGRALLATVGGSLGARRINLAVIGAVGAWADRRDLAVRQVVGERDWELVTSSAPDLPPGGLVWQPVEFERRMDLVLAAADVVVCRAGASTVFELAAVGVPAVLVPFPGATADHQTANARVLERAGAGVLVPDGELTPDRLRLEVDALLADPDRLAAMGDAARTVGRRDAADRVAALVEQHAARPS